MPRTTLPVSRVFNLADAIAIADGGGTIYALPGRASAIAVQVSTAVVFGAFDLLIEVSLDAISWGTLMTFDESGGVQTEITAAPFIRYNIVSHTGGSGLTVAANVGNC